MPPHLTLTTDPTQQLGREVLSQPRRRPETTQDPRAAFHTAQAAPGNFRSPEESLQSATDIMSWAQDNPLDAAALGLSMVPVVGDAVGLAADAKAIADDPSWQNFALAAIGALPFVPGGALARAVRKTDDAIAAAPAPQPGITAYHGSPHDFDQFSMEKIGTGEGAQAYGHGLYFAENEDVARSYRQDLAEPDTAEFDKAGIPPSEWTAARMFSKMTAQGRPEAAAADFANWTGRDVTPELVEAFRRAEPKGRMYEVRINADPEDFLDWDKPLSEQSERVRDAVNRVARDPDVALDRITDDARGIDLKRLLQDPTAAEKLRAQGIPGIRYLDQGSRTAGEGSRNYVVFSDEIISIAKKYGIPLLASGAIAGSMVAPGEAEASEGQAGTDDE